LENYVIIAPAKDYPNIRFLPALSSVVKRNTAEVPTRIVKGS